jgi:hypothetical protein
MRSLVFVGLLLNGTAALAASCKQPSTPDIPVDAPVHDRAEDKLNRTVARYIRDSAGHIDCSSADDSVDPSTVAAKPHVQESLDARGLRPNEFFITRLTIVNLDVLLRLGNAEVAADQSSQ